MNSPSAAPARFSTPLFETLVQQLLLLHLLLSPLIFNRGSLEVFEYSKVALLLTTALLLTGFGLSAGSRRSARQLGDCVRSPLVLGFLLFAVSAVCSTCASIQPRTSLWGTFESFSGLWTMLAYVVLFLATQAAVRTPEAARRLLAGCTGATAFVAAYAVVQAAGWDPLPWALVSQVGAFARPFATMGHGNFLSAFLVMAFPLTAYFALLAWRDRQWLSLGMLLFVQTLSVGAIVATLSRGAWLALGCVLLVLALGWAGRSRQRWLKLGLAFLLTVGCAVGCLWLLGKTETGLLASVNDRLRQLGEAGSRRYVWRASLAMFQDRPLFGCGLDAFPLAFGKYRPPELWHVERDLTPLKAHNELLHVLATQGLLGGLAVLTVLAGLVQAGGRAWRNAMPADRPLVLAIVAGIVGFLVQVSFSFTVAGCGTLFVTFCALLTSLARPRGHVAQVAEPAEASAHVHAACLLGAGVLAGLLFWHNLDPLPWHGKPLAWAGCGAIALCFAGTLAVLLRLEGPTRRMAAPPVSWCPRWPVVAWQLAVWAGVGIAFVQGVWRPYRADLACAEGEAWLPVDRQEALRHYREATLRDPQHEVYWLKRGLAELPASEALPAEERRRQLLLARDSLQRAAELGPANAGTRVALAQVLGELARQGAADSPSRAAAFAEIDAALLLEPLHPAYLNQAGELALNLGDLARAGQYLRRGLDCYPLNLGLCVQSARLAVQQGRYPEAVRFIDLAAGRQSYASEGDTGLWGATSSLAAGYLFVQAPQTAVKLAQEVLKHQPRWLAPRCTLAIGLERQGRAAEARREYERILAEQPAHRAARLGLERLDAAAVQPRQ